LGGSIQRPIDQNLSLVVRAELVQGQDLPDDTLYFCVLQYSFGPQTTSTNFNNTNWLTPVYGSNTEYLKTICNLHSYKEAPIKIDTNKSVTNLENNQNTSWWAE
jgi:Tfp pilus assembly protein PilW